MLLGVFASQARKVQCKCTGLHLIYITQGQEFPNITSSLMQYNARPFTGWVPVPLVEHKSFEVLSLQEAAGGVVLSLVTMVPFDAIAVVLLIFVGLSSSLELFPHKAMTPKYMLVICRKCLINTHNDMHICTCMQIYIYLYSIQAKDAYVYLLYIAYLHLRQ